MEHELKIWPEFFEKILSGEKTVEIRRNDRRPAFRVGDTLSLQEFVPCKLCGGGGRVWDVGDRCDCVCPKPHGKYTGRKLLVQVTHMLDGNSWGLQDGYVAMSFKRVANGKMRTAKCGTSGCSMHTSNSGMCRKDFEVWSVCNEWSRPKGRR